MIKKLKDIATTITGLYKKADPVGNTFYLQGRQFNQQGFLNKDSIMTKDIWVDSNLERHLLKDKDILFVAKGERNRACLYREEYGRAVASSLFFVIRVTTDALLPEYLHWFLNSNTAQIRIETFSMGSRIPSISKKSLQELEIQIPTMETQKRILELNQLWQNEKNLTHELINQKEIYYQNLLFKISKGKEE